MYSSSSYNCLVLLAIVQEQPQLHTVLPILLLTNSLFFTSITMDVQELGTQNSLFGLIKIMGLQLTSKRGLPIKKIRSLTYLLKIGDFCMLILKYFTREMLRQVRLFAKIKVEKIRAVAINTSQMWMSLIMSLIMTLISQELF